MKRAFVCVLGLGLFFLVEPGLAEERKQSYEVTTADSKEFAEYCKHEPCQKNLHVRVKKKDGSYFDKRMELFPPSVQPSWIAIVAGQALNIEATVSNGKFVKFRIVKEIENPKITMTASLTQHENLGMILKITNPFPQDVRFRMGIMPIDSEKLLKTSSCPVTKGGVSFEAWPSPLFQVVLADASFVKDGESLECR